MLVNWGTTLSDQAKTKAGGVADKLFAQAYDKHEEVLKMKPDFYEVLNSWGGVLLYQAQSKRGSEAEVLIKQASEKCLKADEFNPGIGSYNLACITALRGNVDECRKWFENCLKYGTLPEKEFIEKDKDLDSVRDKKWFKELLENL